MQALTFFIAAWLLVCGGAYAENNDLPHVTVFGTATTEVVPDQTIWSLNVRNKASMLQDAAREHAAIVQQVLQLLKDQKVSEENTQTSQMQFGENREYRGNSWVREGYFASTDISCTLKDLAQYSPLWMGLSKIPNVSVRSVQYEHSHRIEYQNETCKKAVLAAKDKAHALAKTLGSAIAEPLAVEEDISMEESWGRPAMFSVRVAEAESGMVGEHVAPGKIAIKAKIKVVFRLLSQGN